MRLTDLIITAECNCHTQAQTNRLRGGLCKQTRKTFLLILYEILQLKKLVKPMVTDVFRIFGQLTTDLGNFAKAAYSKRKHIKLTF